MTEYVENQDERLRILKMVEDGKISAGEGVDLLSSIGQKPLQKDESPNPKKSGEAPRWFCVEITDLVTGKHKTSVTIPMGLVDWGLRVGAQFAPGADIDLEELGSLLRAGEAGKIIDVLDEEDGEHVEIFVR